ncbi:MAG: T9SS type A sorting domain-containing protein, partial [Rhodothermales bacterium]
LIIGSSPRGIYISEDDGQTWRMSNAGLDAAAVSSMAADADGVLFAGTYQGVFRSEDQGTTWEHLSLGQNNVESLLVTSSGLVVAGTNNNGIYISSDGGETWSPVDTSFSMRGAQSLAEAPNGDLFAGGSDESVLRSTDGWATWDTVDSGPTFQAVKALGVSQSGTVFAGTDENLRLSRDGGDTWEDAATGLPVSPDVRAFELLANGDVLAAAFGGVFRFMDGESAWVETETRPGFGITSIERAGEYLYVTLRGGGVSVSGDEGATWALINDGLNNLDATSLVFQPANGTGKSGTAYQSASDVLYVGTRGGGVSRLTSVATATTREVPDAERSARLGTNYPNPFSGQTTFRLRLERPMEINATLFDILGRKVRTFDQRSLPAGETDLRIDGSTLATGVYMFRVDFGDGVEERLVTVGR